MQTTLTSLTADQSEAAVGLLARAFVGDPLHIATFGPDRLDANEAFFRVALAAMKGKKVMASENGRMVAMAHWVPSASCQYPMLEQLEILPRMIGAVGLARALRVVRWLSSWSRHDLSEPHSHLGPIAVEPDAQGQGIGSSLMDGYCEELDRTGVAGFLETDKARNVRLYERFGFKVTATTSILGVENYFMLRERR